MKTIYFKSDTYNELYSTNNAHKFRVNIPKDILSYNLLHQVGSSNTTSLIHAAVKSVSFRLSQPPQTAQALALQSDLSTNHTCFGSQYESIVSTFVLGTHEDEGNLFVSQQINPTFIQTNIEKLSSCSFNLYNLEDQSDTALSYIDKVAPTIVEVWIKSREESRDTMQQQQQLPFHIFVKSSDIESKKTFPQNTKTNFKFQLAERKHLSGKWGLSLRNLIVSRKLFLPNIPNGSSFHMSYNQFDYVNIRYNGIIDRMLNPFYRTVTIPVGYFSSVEKLVNHVMSLLPTISKQQLKLEYIDDGDELNNKVRINISNVELRPGGKRVNTLILSEPLAIVLGFAPQEGLDGEETVLNLSVNPQDHSTHLIDGKHVIRLPPTRDQPKQVLLNCNIIEPSLFGSTMTPILHLISMNTSERDDTIMHISFPEHNFKDLSVNSFDHIKFWFEDENGNPLYMDNDDSTNFSTFITLSFVKLT